jgi:hypothetical protein
MTPDILSRPIVAKSVKDLGKSWGALRHAICALNMVNRTPVLSFKSWNYLELYAIYGV